MILKKNLPFLAILLSALLAMFSHPTVLGGIHFPNLSFLAWVAYVPLFWAVLSENPRTQFRRVFLFAFLFYMGALYWLYTAMNTFGNLSPTISVIVLIIVAVAVTLYMAVIFPLSAWIQKNLNVSPFWSLPLLWVSLEWVRARWPVGGFPWAQAAYSQAGSNILIQMADLTGVYGVTALIVWVNLALYELMRGVKEKNLKPVIPQLVFVVLLLGAAFSYGAWAQKHYEKILSQAPRIKLALTQGSISQDEKWLSQKAKEILKNYQEMTNQAFSQGAQIVIWPESSFPYDLALDRPEQVKLLGVYPGDLVAGSVTYNFRDMIGSRLTHPREIYNTALLIRPPGELISSYHKQHLVPYGEYIPFKSILPFLGKLTAQIGEFHTGNSYTTLDSGEARMGPLICYEDIFPDISRHHAERGANLLINLTNDAWYGDSSALPQHLSFSPFRAVENRRSVARSTNTGLTATLDPLGRLQKIAPPWRKEILIDEVSLVSEQTFYTRRGDVFVFGCMILSGMMLLMSFGRKMYRKI